MNILTMNVQQETANLLPGKSMNRAGGATETASFLSFLHQSQAAVGQHQDNLFGVAVATAGGALGDAVGPGARLDKAINLEEIDTVAGLLQQMMAMLNQQAEPVHTGPGDWVVTMPDTGILEQLGVAAGMTSQQLGKFVQSFTNDDDTVSLGQLLDALASHFAALDKDQPIVVPDTDLPLFQLLLSRMGIEVNSLDAIASKVITNDDALDLSRLLVALKELPVGEETSAVVLSSLELEQLQAVLLRAGLPADKLQAMLPTVAGEQAVLPKVGEEQGASLSLTSLKDLLGQAIQEIQAARPQVDPTAFLRRLEGVFVEAGFQEKGIGWTPVVQNSVENIFQKLLEIVDPATVRISGVQAVAAAAVPVSDLPGRDLSDQGGDMAGQFAQVTEAEAETPAAGSLPAGDSSQSGLEAGSEKNLAGLDQEPQPAAMNVSAIKEPVVVPEGVKEPAILPRTAPVPVQQTMEQLSQGVLHGARNKEHHLVLKLFPEDLGEVKVVLHVRNEQVSVAFSMANTQVKEILEQNMQQFRENLQKHGFVLEQCSASLDHNDKPGSGQHGFDFAMRQPWEGGRGSVAELPEGVLYRRAAAPARVGGIDLFM